jgi:hypothetical protein
MLNNAFRIVLALRSRHTFLPRLVHGARLPDPVCRLHTAFVVAKVGEVEPDLIGGTAVVGIGPCEVVGESLPLLGGPIGADTGRHMVGGTPPILDSTVLGDEAGPQATGLGGGIGGGGGGAPNFGGGVSDHPSTAFGRSTPSRCRSARRDPEKLN